MNGGRQVSGWAFIASTALLLGCANPFGGGGTETSNPGMFACAHAVFEEVESPRNRLPEKYLPSGGAELDPARGREKKQRETYATVDASTRPSDPPRMRLLSFRKHTGGMCSALSVHFDAGGDRCFASVADNRILELDRETALANKTLERVTFRNHPMLGTGDSIELIRDTHSDTGLVRDGTVRYVSVPEVRAPGHDTLWPARITKALSFRGKCVLSVELEIAFDKNMVDKATVWARMYYGQGREGRFRGTIDLRARTLTGRYAEEGRESSVVYARTGNTLSWKDRDVTPVSPPDRQSP